MIELTVSPTWSLVLPGAPPAELEAVADVLSVTNPEYYQALQRGSYGTPKKVSLMFGNLFPSGLVDFLKRHLNRKGIKLRILKSDVSLCPVRKKPFPGMFEGIELNDEQMLAIRKALEAPSGRGYINAHPAFGKTEVIFAILRCLLPCRAILIVTRAGLRQQGAERFMRRLAGENVHILGKDSGPLPASGLVITTYHTLHRRLFGAKAKGRKRQLVDKEVLAYCEAADVLLADEVHRAPGRMYLECLQMIRASRRYGFSATPMKRNNPKRNMNLRGWIGECIYKVPLKKQVELGRLSSAHVFFRNIGKGDPLFLGEMFDYRTAFEAAYMEYRPFLSQVLLDALWFYNNQIPCLILVDWTAPGQKLHDLLTRIMPAKRVAFLHGSIPPRKRVPVKQAFIDGDIKVMVATGVLSEGEDLPNISAVICASAGRDPGVLYQKAGRGLRPNRGQKKSNKMYLVVYLNRRHRYFLGHAKEAVKYFASKKELYTIHEPDAPLEVIG